MSEFDDLLRDSVAPLVVSMFGDSVVYQPGNGGKRRTIEAVLERMMLEVVSETGTMLVPAVTVKVRNDAIHGISSKELDTGRDKIVLAVVYGDVPQPRQIARRMSDDGGFLVLLVQ